MVQCICLVMTLYNCYSRFTEIITSNKVRWSLTRVLRTGTVEGTISMATCMFTVIVIIGESRGICPKMVTRAPICDGNAIHIVRVDISNEPAST